jgi:hypothetical protein
LNTNTSREIPADGSPLSCDAGSYTISLVRTKDGGFTIYVMAASYTYDELTNQFPTEDLARAEASTYWRRLTSGETVWDLIRDKQTAEHNLVASINATMGEAHDRMTAPRQAARQIAAEVMGNGRGFDRFADRRNVNQKHTHGEPSDAMRRAVSLANAAGEIRVQPGVAVTTLRAMADRGLGRLVYGGTRRYEVVKLVLNQAGIQLGKAA